MFACIIWTVFLAFPDRIDIQELGFKGSLGASSVAVSRDGSLVLKGRVDEAVPDLNGFLVVNADGKISELVNVALIEDEEILGHPDEGRIIQNIVKIKGRYLAFVLTWDKKGRGYGDVLTFDEDLIYLGRARTYNSNKPPFLRNLVEGSDGSFFGLEFWREKPESMVFRWSRFNIWFQDGLPVFKKARASFWIDNVALGTVPASYTRSWVAVTPDGGTLLAIDELGDMAEKYKRKRNYEFDVDLPLSQEGFVYYKQALTKNAQEDVAQLSQDELQYGLSKNTGLFALEGRGDLFVIGYEVPTHHPQAKLSVVLQVIDSNGETLHQEEPVLGGLFLGVVKNRAWVLAPDLTTENESDFWVKKYTY